MPIPNGPLGQGRASFDRRAWAEAFESLVRADGAASLELEDLERLAWSAALTGRDEAFLGTLERLHKASVELGQPRRAARASFWIGWYLSSFGSNSAAEGWFAAANRLVESEPEACAERGYLLLPVVYRCLAAADCAGAAEAAGEAARIGELCAERDLVAFARNLEARSLIAQGRLEQGLALLDELMVDVTSGELSPLVTGIVYCSALVSCQDCFALDRARQWTAALSRFCSEQPELVTFKGICLVRRAELKQLGGAWDEAIDEVRQVCDRSTRGDPEILGTACYQQAELFRLRGEFEKAENSYRLASENGSETQPGLALLRLSQGQIDFAVGAIRRLSSTTSMKWQRARLLPAFVEIMLSAGQLDEARGASIELAGMAEEHGGEILGAIAAHARGAVALAEGKDREAVEALRHAFGVWQKADAPYLAARIRVLLGRAYAALGDRDGAELEQSFARKVFEELGALPDLALLDASSDVSSDAAGESTDSGEGLHEHGLSKREIEILRLVAAGKTNKGIARELFVSSRTVDRHLSNIFTKIGVTSRAGATAFAYENGLVGASGSSDG